MADPFAAGWSILNALPTDDWELWIFAASEQPSVREATPESHLPRVPTGRAGRRVLFIEDDPSIADMYALRLRQDGWQVTIAQSGEEGVALALAEPPEVILLDIMLPGIDGVEVLARLRRSQRTSSIPVLVLSNSPGLAGRLERAQHLGILGWRVKASTTPADLSTEIRSFLR